MSKVRLSASLRVGPRVQARIKLARLLELPESEIAARILDIEADPLFRRLAEAGVLSVQPFRRVRFTTRAMDGRHLRAADDGLGDLIDGGGELAGLMRKVGQDRFEACFLGEARLSDAQRAKTCGITQAEAKALREFVDRLYVRSEFEAAEPRVASATVYTTVAGIVIEAGRPVLAFFDREVWKGRYLVDQERYSELKTRLAPEQAAETEQFMCRVNLIAFRQTNLYRILEALIGAQASYLSTGDPDKRVPLTQRKVATDLKVAPSVLNALIANKSVELPWRLEAPVKALLPSRKTLMRDRLYDLAIERPEAGDDALREELRSLYGAALSRPSIIQYRKELGLGGCGQRGGQEVLR